MKTTIDLPPDLLRQLRLRAVQDGRKLKDIAAEFLRGGLATPAASKPPDQLVIVKDKKTGLPVIQCRRAASPGLASPRKIAQSLADQENEWFRESA